MDKKVQERRRQVNQERGRRRAGLIFLGALAVVAVALFLWLRSSDVFAVEQISAPVAHHVTQEQVAEAVAAARGESLLKVSTAAIEETLAVLPYVRTIHVYRSFPHSLEVRLEEYEPVARVRNADGKVWLVADDGHVLEKAQAQAAPSLPLIVVGTSFTAQPGGTMPQTAAGALPVALLLQSAGVASELPAVEQISVSAGGEVVVHLQGGTEIRLGVPTDLKQKISVAAKIIQENLRDGKTLQYVDASAVDRLAVKAE
jgi:cell division septal protein FtsQ